MHLNTLSYSSTKVHHMYRIYNGKYTQNINTDIKNITLVPKKHQPRSPTTPPPFPSDVGTMWVRCGYDVGTMC